MLQGMKRVGWLSLQFFSAGLNWLKKITGFTFSKPLRLQTHPSEKN